MASPTALAARAEELVHLATVAGDHRALAGRVFAPVVASWDAIAAPELQRASPTVRAEAGELASQLAWAAVPLRYWADRVYRFNRKVDELRDRYDRAPAEPERRAELVRKLEREWHDAFGAYVDEGERTAAGMFTYGPTWEYLAAARAVGAIPSGPMVAFFTVGWDRTAGVDEALRIAEVIADPDRQPTDEELERLAGVLDRYAADQEFGHAFRYELGAAGLWELVLGVAALDGEREPAVLAAIRAGLGVPRPGDGPEVG